VEWAPDEEPISIAVDAMLVLEALSELLDNACGFSPAETPVHLRVVSSEEGVVWSIEQHSPAPPSLVDQWGLTPLVSTRRGHYGLGLYRARRILHAHRASVAYRYDQGRQKVIAEVCFPRSAM
jgi:K+-sensing histidine kinase KdpD